MESYKLVNFSKYSSLKVTEASIEEVLTSDPFLLVYERTCKYSILCVDLLHSYVLYFFIDNHSHSLSLNQSQRVINNQWLSDEVHYCGFDFDFDQNYFLLFFRS